MIQFDNVSFSYPQKDLLNNITFTIEAGEHCVLIGTSGSGKSTLLNMIMKSEDFLYDGTIKIMPNCRIGYVSQFSQLVAPHETTVYEYLAEHYNQLQEELAAISLKLETAEDMDTLLEEYQLVLDSLDAIGGADFEQSIKRKLNQANLSAHENRLISELSGGEFKIIQVMKEMLTNPDMLIMDEPDVFLDFDNLNSLKNLINSHKGTLLVITHNRYLLNHCFNKVLHLENKELQEFSGNYIDYNYSLLQRKVELQELAEADTAELERNEMLIDQLRSVATNNADASRGKALKARIKIKERLEARRIKAPFVDIKQPDIRFTIAGESGENTLLKVSNYSIAFDELLLENVSFEMKSKDKLAIIGPNGTGKTTLLRDIYRNNQAPIEIKEGVNVAYLSQSHSETLNEENTLLNEFLDAGFQTNDQVKSYLSGYGFTEEDISQRIGALSGGEKNILQLAKIAARKADLLLLDEPTSHLDTYSQVALEKAINEYPGAVLMVSHDFYTIANCMDYVFIIENKTLRKMSIRKFRKMIYSNHFDKDYLEIEQKKKELETRIARALKDKDFIQAKLLLEELEAFIKLR